MSSTLALERQAEAIRAEAQQQARLQRDARFAINQSVNQ
jgi:hypothetical protein